MDEQTLDQPHALAPELPTEPTAEEQATEEPTVDEREADGEETDDTDDTVVETPEEGDPGRAKAVRDMMRWKGKARDFEAKLADAQAQLEATADERDKLRTAALERTRADVIADLVKRGNEEADATAFVELAEVRGLDLLSPTVTDCEGDERPAKLQDRVSAVIRMTPAKALAGQAAAFALLRPPDQQAIELPKSAI